ncbi:hypothetical protein [Halorussus lipolyticus]|uniref:hypothetical protein n=1 Tax=Halorussus lipolyticus TaxID=3034024 RepID=UPI0023E7907C|nr:hypothetical protein [Halorussus sp. DT80]
MDRTLELPNGDVVTPEDVFLYNNYPYRVRFPDAEEDADGTRASEYEFEFSPLYWGGGEMDIPFREREALVEQWGEDSRGTMTADEWGQWLAEARSDDRFGDDELDALARELPGSASGSLVDRLRDALSF